MSRELILIPRVKYDAMQISMKHLEDASKSAVNQGRQHKEPITQNTDHENNDCLEVNTMNREEKCDVYQPLVSDLEGGGSNKEEIMSMSPAQFLSIVNNKSEKVTEKRKGAKRKWLKEHLKERCKALGHIKWYLVLQVRLTRESNLGEIDTAEPYFHSGTFHMLQESDDLDHNFNKACQLMFKSFDEYIRKGSGWSINKVLTIEAHTAYYKPINGSSYMELPRSIRYTGGIVNIQNKDEKCFAWSVLASLHPADSNAQRVQHYQDYESQLNMSGIPYPVPLSKISTFEKLNNISVNILGFEEETIFPLYISTVKEAAHEVDLLYLQNEETSHYCWIKNLNRVLARTKTRKHNHHFCRYCLQGFQQKHTLEKHLRYCSVNDAQCISMPEQGKDDVLTFKDFHKQMRVPFVIYADFETFAKKTNADLPDPSKSNTTSIVHYTPCGYGYQVVCVDERYTKDPVIYRGDDVSEHFLRSIMEEEEEIKEILRNVEPMELSEEEQTEFENSTHCHICENVIIDTKVRDHCHVSGRYRGAACSNCNLNFRHPKFIPVIFHNLKNFDAHILCQSIGLFKEEEIKCIPNNMQKYVSFSLGKLRFIDSYQFTNCSLADMVENLYHERHTSFKNFYREFQDSEKAELLLRKGVYPYEYVDCAEKFEESTIPPQNPFYSHLRDNHISDDDYKHVHNVWDTMNINNLGEYHDLYLKTDVLLLADCFEQFRDMCQKHYKLDPCHFYTCPGLAWSAALKMTKCKLDLLTDPDMYLFFEKGIRGGISVISKKYAKANNKSAPDYNQNSPTSFIHYVDANNLYGWSMCKALPEKNFRWMTEKEIETFEVSKIPNNSKKGYALEVDLEYPSELHDKHNCYPLAPETLTISNEELSPYSKKLWIKQNRMDDTDPSGNMDKDKNGIAKRIITPKLIPNLRNKQNYVIHYKNLKLYLKKGLKLTKIHRILEFDQSPWLKPYIDFNTEQRKIAKNKFEKDFFKLMNNSVFGKTMENVRSLVDIRLIHTQEKLKKQTAKSSFQRFTIFNEDLVGVELKKVNLKLNKPVYVGFTTLDISKILLFRFHYDYMQKKYGDKAQLLFTDTDSLMYHIETGDLYKDMEENEGLFDLSNFPEHHFLHDKSNVAIPGFFKDETAGMEIYEFCGLRSKMYSFIYGDSEKKKAKGLAKSAVRKHLRHIHYKQSLFDEDVIMCGMHAIRSSKHELFINRINKAGLSAFDDKRWVKEDGISTFAHGHYRTLDYNDSQ
ncbi:hypothetical protein FSP39_019099 [Pinctada imbricata]|uniref:DNA-directed DNA polymerase n=1 Tax=Pinctada imbricata TaxID=66713 RepID=A0AA88YXK8_PINIB|nr:hypothetical protein FSP39_019099 [Pinctada imbricata]